jgi:biotin carboxyl carrier protein
MNTSHTALLLALAFATPAFAQDATTEAAAESAEAAAETDVAEASEAADASEAPAAAEAAATTEAAPVADEAPAVATPVSAAVAAVVGTPEPGKGLVVFFRPSKFVGGGAAIKVHEGDTVHGKLGNGTWFAVNLDPGTHEFVAKGEVKDRNPIEIEAGETYFLNATISMGFVAGRKNLALTSPADFEAIMGKLKPAKPLKN